MNRKKSKNKLIFLVAIIIVIIAILCIIIIPKNSDDAIVENNAKELKEMEDANISEIQKQIIATAPKLITQYGEKTDYRTIFSSSVIVGDSIVEGLDVYDYLDLDQAIYKRGVSSSGATGITDKAISLKPSYLFFTLGLNDLENSNGDSSGLIKGYKPLIAKAKKELPDAKIYVNSLMPASKARLASDPVLKNYKKFNEELKKMCDEEDVTFIDHTQTVLSHSDLYEADGLHFKSAFYSFWLDDMVKAAGII